MDSELTTHRLLYPDGRTKYEGGWKNNQENGIGRLYYDNGNLNYEGQWLNGRMQGTGQWYRSNGKLQYEGQFLDNLPHGHIIEYRETGERLYEGAIQLGILNGYGTIYYDTGVICYEGMFSNGMMNGTGKSYDRSGSLVFEGPYKNGKINGSGAKIKRIFSALAILFIVITLSYKYYPDIKGAFSKVIVNQDDSHKAIRAAKKIMEQNLASPSSAKWVSSDIVDQNEPYFMVHLVVDANNSFGVSVRTSMLVSVTMGSGNQYTYNPLTSVTESSDPPQDFEIMIMKQLNGWPGSVNLKDNPNTQEAMQSDIEIEMNKTPEKNDTSTIITNEVSATSETSIPLGDSLVRGKAGSLAVVDWKRFDDPDVVLPLTFGDTQLELVIGMDHPNGMKKLIRNPQDGTKRPLDFNLPGNGFDEYGTLMDDYRVQAGTFDFDRDGVDELWIASGNLMTEATIMVYAYKEGSLKADVPFEEILVADGQIAFILEDNQVQVPIGSSGVDHAYAYTNHKFIEVVN
ncbi:toxin-antitoxin system YwqK family antitoxin [Cohnella sp. WQ 127256]|uniref:toxin-antitoxin system YwqK family antitoxin n=1 Tax=Cohnella sp. WQ 127256 TaxID=2938790 RepID=UPI002117C6D2|nr:toxin-antitoxin system YwqK family antitoxin [Cohnella sp. WQ 127256]